MFRLRAAMLAVVVATATYGLSASPAAAADQLAACDATTATGLQWAAPSFMAWGRQDRIGANAVDPGDGPGYDDGSLAMSVDAGSVSEADDPVDHDFEFVVKAPASGAAVGAKATWTMIDATGTVTCAQTAALSIPLGPGKTLSYRPKVQGTGITWVPSNNGDCHDIAVEGISLTVTQGSVTRRLNADDQCNLTGHQRVATPDWELVVAGGRFQLHALKTHSSLKTRLRYALRVGPRRVASGSVTLVRHYKPGRLIDVSNVDFQPMCVHGRYQPKWYGNTVGCKIPAVFSIHIALTA
jgi:hypothetical protein